MAKYVQQNFDVYGIAEFKNSVQFDSSVYLKGVTHISSPQATGSTTPYALVVNSIGSDVSIQSIQLGTMATATAADYYTSAQTDTAIGDVSARVDILEQTDTAYASDISDVSTRVETLENYDAIQDASIQKNWDRWIDSHRRGFVDNTETTLSFTDTSGLFTLTANGSEWSYYKGGIKYTISGNKTVTLPSGGLAAPGTYYITITDDIGTLEVSAVNTPWTFDPNVVFVATVDFNSTGTPKYVMADERHTMLIDYQMHKYLHSTTGTQFVSGGELTGPDVSAGDITVTNSNNAVGVAQTVIADEDLFITLAPLARPNGGGNDYFVWRRDSSDIDQWKLEGTPLTVNASYIQYDDGTDMVDVTPGKFVNTYIAFTDLTGGGGNPQFSIIPGQGQFDTVDDAINENPANFDFTGLPIAEWVIAYQLTWESSTGYTTDGKVALAAEPKRINVTSTSSSAPSTTSHNDLLGLQGGNATQRYHLSLAQYNDWAGKSYIDASLGVRDSSITSLFNKNVSQDASIVGLRNVNTAQDASIVALRAKDAAQDASIIRIDSSIVTLNSAIQTNATDIFNLEGSVGNLDTLTQSHTAELLVHDNSIGFLWSYDQIQDASIVAAGASVSGWNGLVRVDNSIGLGGTGLVDDTVIYTNAYQLAIDGTVQITGNLTVDGSITYLNTAELDVSDNIIYINTGLTGVPPTSMVSGMKVNRGSSDPYFFIFSEADDTFRIGENASEGGLPAGTQAVATRQDSPQDEGVAFWNNTAKRFDTVTDFKFNATTGLTIADRITGSGGLTLTGLDASTQVRALMVDADSGSIVTTRALGTNAFSSAAFATIAYVDGSLSARDTSIANLVQITGNLDSSIGDLDTLTQAHTAELAIHDASIGDLYSQSNTFAADIAQLDASIVRIDASLNDVIEATDLFYTKTYIDGSLNAKANDASLALYLEKAGDTMTGLLTLATQGFTLDGVTITTIDTSTEGFSLNNSSIPTSLLVSQAISEAIAAGVTADNGLTENPTGNIQLGGALSKPTTITATDASALKFAGITNVANEQTVYAESSLGNLITTELGDMAFATTTDYTTRVLFDASVVEIYSAIDAVDASVVTAGLGITNNAQVFDVNITDIDASGNELLVKIDTGGTDVLYIDSKDITNDNLVAANGTTLDGNEIKFAHNAGNELYVDSGLITQDNLVAAGGDIGGGGTLTPLSLYYNTPFELNVKTDEIVEAIASTQAQSGNLGVGLYYDADYLPYVSPLEVVQIIATSQGYTAGDVLVKYDADASIFVAKADILTVVGGAARGAGNGLKILTDASYGLGGSLSEPTTITASAANTLIFAGLQTSTVDTPYALVQDTADTSIRTRQLGTMAWETAANYGTKTYIAIEDASVVSFFTDWNDTQDASIENLQTGLGNYVLKAGDTMTGGLTIGGTAGGLLVGSTGNTLDTSLYGGLYVHDTLTVGGDLYVDGSLYVTNVETIDVSAAYIHLNTGLTGTPPSGLQSGIVIGRGSEDPYVFVFDESLQQFRIGIAEASTGTGYTDSSTQAVATREDAPTGDGIAFWNSTADRIDTASGFTYNGGVLTTPNLTLSSLSADTQSYALMTTAGTGGVVSTRQLGPHAFDTSVYALQSAVDASLVVVWTKFGNIDTSLGTLNGLINTNASSITTNANDIGFLESSVGDLDTLTQSLSTDKLDAVANINVAGDASVFAYETGTTAYLKKIKGGAGTTITEDASTITIAVAGAAASVFKYTGTFTVTGTSEVVNVSSVFDAGPYQVSVFEAGEQVYPGVAYSGTNVTLSWSPGALTGLITVIVTG